MIERFKRIRFKYSIGPNDLICAANDLYNTCRVEFTVGDRPVSHFRMIERHFFRDQLLKTFDFEFGFCIPNSRNTCEHIYEFPQLSQELVDEMTANPYETRSDSFYFVDDKLVMHNKADYAYTGGRN